MEINPSTFGWIEKFTNQFSESITDYESEETFYEASQRSGLIYGYVVSYHLNIAIDDSHWDEEEKTKVAFFTTLFSMYKLHVKSASTQTFIEDVLEFYNSISKAKFSFIHKLLPESSSSQKLEELIEDRIQTNNNIVSKNFTHLVTNAMLFVDVLAYDHYLKNGEIDLKFFKEVEQKCMTLISLALQLKSDRSEYDDLLLKLFENSLRYTKAAPPMDGDFISQLEQEDLSILQRLYLLDVLQMALWSDGEKSKIELDFTQKIISILKLNDNIQNTGLEIDSFIEKHRINIPYFNSKHPVKHLYTNTQDGISKLIVRNKKRLVKELSESKELVKLLRKSTTSELSADEKKKVKKQLLDICKSVPSLTIFLLPGGGLLLPLLIKFIPQLLPSAFNENLED